VTTTTAIDEDSDLVVDLVVEEEDDYGGKALLLCVCVCVCVCVACIHTYTHVHEYTHERTLCRPRMTKTQQRNKRNQARRASSWCRGATACVRRLKVPRSYSVLCCVLCCERVSAVLRM
jgi:hypothetical protein